jgi:transposase-like protein
MTAIFDAPHFTDDRAAREFLERVLWPDGPTCPHCGVIGNAFGIKRKGVPTGVYRCNERECRKDFTVTMKTVMERSHIALRKWLLGFHLMTSSKKGVSAHQLHRTLGITYRSAWFMAHRIREAMRAGGLVPAAPIGGEGKIVEADETYLGMQDNPKPSRKRTTPYTKGGRSGPSGKRAVLALVERGGNARMFHLAVADKPTVTKLVRDNIAKESRFHTDESKLYIGSVAHFASHEAVKHSHGEYVRGDVHSNTVEGVFSVFKRGMKGIYQHCAEKHLHRYLAEYEFRHNHRIALGFNDKDRTFAAVKGAEGKRLTYRQPRFPDAPF